MGCLSLKKSGVVPRPSSVARSKYRVTAEVMSAILDSTKFRQATPTHRTSEVKSGGVDPENPVLHVSLPAL